MFEIKFSGFHSYGDNLTAATMREAMARFKQEHPKPDTGDFLIERLGGRAFLKVDLGGARDGLVRDGLVMGQYPLNSILCTYQGAAALEKACKLQDRPGIEWYDRYDPGTLNGMKVFRLMPCEIALFTKFLIENLISVYPRECGQGAHNFIVDCYGPGKHACQFCEHVSE